MITYTCDVCNKSNNSGMNCTVVKVSSHLYPNSGMYAIRTVCSKTCAKKIGRIVGNALSLINKEGKA